MSTSQTTVVKAAYWFPDGGDEVSDINSKLFTHLYCAFANVNSTTYKVSIAQDDAETFSAFTETVQKKNPDVKTLLSIGGEHSKSSTFAAMASQASRRKAFIVTSIQLARDNSFHGLDIDWEYPKTDAQMTDFGSLLTEWRSAVEKEAANNSRPALLLTAAVFRNAKYYNDINYPFSAVSASLDWINVMTYDYYGPGWDVGKTETYPPAALYDRGLNRHIANGDAGITSWIARIPSKKVVFGLPFYGYAWKLTNAADDHGFFATANGAEVEVGANSNDGTRNYNEISALMNNGFQPEYNKNVVSNYCYNETTWIGYDGKESISDKISYAKAKALLGYFAWHTGADTNTWTLSRTASDTWGNR